MGRHRADRRRTTGCWTPATSSVGSSRRRRGRTRSCACRWRSVERAAAAGCASAGGVSGAAGNGVSRMLLSDGPFEAKIRPAGVRDDCRGCWARRTVRHGRSPAPGHRRENRGASEHQQQSQPGVGGRWEAPGPVAQRACRWQSSFPYVVVAEPDDGGDSFAGSSRCRRSCWPTVAWRWWWATAPTPTSGGCRTPRTMRPTSRPRSAGSGSRSPPSWMPTGWR